VIFTIRHRDGTLEETTLLQLIHLLQMAGLGGVEATITLVRGEIHIRVQGDEK
jgi:hypothetical protein